MKNIKRKNGFTLFELLVSISIIGILIALASVNFSAAQRKARDSRRIQDMKAIQSGLEQEYSANPAGYVSITFNQPIEYNGQVFLESVPMDPKNQDPYRYLPGSPTGCSSPTSSCYCYCARLEGSTGNSRNGDCAFDGVNSTNALYYCIRNQQ